MKILPLTSGIHMPDTQPDLGEIRSLVETLIMASAREWQARSLKRHGESPDVIDLHAALERARDAVIESLMSDINTRDLAQELVDNTQQETAGLP
jgi:hypothetical protein